MNNVSLSAVMARILEISENSYFRWKKKDHPVLIQLLENYFTKEELIEYLNTGKIEKQEVIKNHSVNELQKKLENTKPNNDFFKNNFIFKCKDLNKFEKLLLIITIKNNIINSKKDLIHHIENYSYYQRHLEQIKDFIKFDIKAFIEKIKMPNNQDKVNLNKFINNYLSDDEIVAFCKNPDYSIL